VVEYLAWRPITQTKRTLTTAWSLQDRHSLSYWDALIVTAAAAGGCKRLLIEDLADGETYGGVTVVNPFTHAPS
jgi:predicted nucleic acid-binding protein